MTIEELAREYFPHAPETWLGYVMWNETAFPFGEINLWRLQLAQLKCTMEFLCGGPFPDSEEEMRRAAAIPDCCSFCGDEKPCGCDEDWD